MKILVTGASGFIGSGLVKKLASEGHEVLALMRSKSSNAFLKDVHFTKASGDLLEPASLARACQGVDVVFHLAGLTAAKDRNQYFEFNATGTRNLAEAALRAGTVQRFVYVSSLAAAGPSPGLCPKLESDPDHPVSNYGESKLRGELFLDELKGKLPFIVIRPPLVYGPRDKNIFMFFQSISKNIMPVLPSKTATGHKYYSAIFVDDLIRALVQSLIAPIESFHNGERFFVTDNQIYTYERIFALIAEAMKVNPIRIRIPEPMVALLANAGSIAGKVLQRSLPLNRDKLNELQPDYWICSPQKIRDQWGFEAKDTLETGIPQTLAWYQLNQWI